MLDELLRKEYSFKAKVTSTIISTGIFFLLALMQYYVLVNYFDFLFTKITPIIEGVIAGCLIKEAFYIYDFVDYVVVNYFNKQLEKEKKIIKNKKEKIKERIFKKYGVKDEEE